MTTWLISRHPGTVQWMQTNGIHFDRHLTHLSDEPIATGDTVIGSLPVHQAANICAKGAQYWNLSLQLPEEARGRELSVDELDLYQLRLEAFRIQPDTNAANPALEHPAPNTETAPAEQPATIPEPQPQPDAHSAETSVLRKASSQQRYEWENELFKKFIFNQDNPRRAELEATLLQEQVASQVDDPEFLSQLETVVRQGRHAVELSRTLQKKIKTGTPQTELQNWVENQIKSQSKRIAKHLKIELKKGVAYRTKKQQNASQNRNFIVTLPYTALVNGLHPQNLRALQPCQEWDFYIDETGTRFDTDASELNETDKNLGRIIALALPKGHSLPALAPQTHGTDLTHSQIQNLLKTITQSQAGILGASLKHDLLSHNWMSAVHQLARWALLMLPMEEGTTCRVRIHIETRAPYTEDNQLLALQDTLDSELKTLLPARFAGLQLSLHIMDKDHPFNGYVDAIANCWGSSDPVKRNLLARTRWRGQCLLQTSDLSRIEDIYRSISSGEQVSGYHWFELCTASIKEAPSSMLHDMLEQLGTTSQNNPGIWLEYLNETRTRMERKDFTPASLQTALGWLERWQSEGQVLPAHLQLELLSQQLASSNHQGEIHLQQVQKLLPLIARMTDESPQAACQALLRIAVRSTHLYDFASTQPLLQQWLEQPVAVPGLLNHAKLHSTLGQLYAFQGKNQQALESFDQALAQFERLSDPAQQTRESQQTRLYRAVVLQDIQDNNSATETFQLANLATRRNGEQSIQHLARSGSALRFVHYLVLRLLVNRPDLNQERTTYLQQQADWASEDGHPWMLINAYRAWLLADNGDTKSATQWMQGALDDCFEAEQPMLLWMGHCLQALAISLQLDIAQTDCSMNPDTPYPSNLLAQLATAADNPQRLQLLQQMLPFNFH